MVWAMAPATPPHSRFTWGFRTSTSGLSDDGRPKSSGAWARPRLLSVPKVKKEKPVCTGERMFKGKNDANTTNKQINVYAVHDYKKSCVLYLHREPCQ